MPASYRLTCLPCIVFTASIVYVRSFIAKVIKDIKADKPAKIIKFSDGAEVQFYLKEHGKARKAIKHVHLSNENVKFLLPTAGASSSSSPTESAGSKEF